MGGKQPIRLVFSLLKKISNAGCLNVNSLKTGLSRRSKLCRMLCYNGLNELEERITDWSGGGCFDSCGCCLSVFFNFSKI